MIYSLFGGNMRNAMKLAVVLSAFAGGLYSLPGIAAAPPVTAEELAKAKPVGTIEVQAEQIRLLLGGAKGKGVLNFQDKSYPFSIKAVTVGGVGVTKVQATGDVYFLKSVSDFPGTYSAATIGLTLGAGKGASQYQNGAGVFISVKSKSEGVAL